MRAIRRYTVRPVLPDNLVSLGELALNLRWSWHADTQALFEQVDPALWAASGHDPIRLLAGLPPDRLARLADDRKFVRNLELINADLDQYLHGDHWYQRLRVDNPTLPAGVGYFSPEFGITEVLPQYSGGLGILAGDHLKAASDLGVPIIGVGLLYRQGYFRQSLSRTGWQEERYPVIDPSELPLRLLAVDGEPALIKVPLGEATLAAQIWVAQVGRVPLLLLDSDVEANGDVERSVTDRLYGGGPEHRLAQELLLGIGGVRAIRAYCAVHPEQPVPEVFHTNEGHAGFLGLERLREYVAAGEEPATAMEQVRAGTVFTTHTPVPAGIDRFSMDLVAATFAKFGLPVDQILALGREDYPGGDETKFNMAVMGLRLAQRANGVSRLHGAVSREMFHGLWPAFDADEVPIGSITNGVHHETWVHPRLLDLLAGDTAEAIDGYDWSALERVDDATLWGLKRRMRLDLIAMARARLSESTRHRAIADEWVHDALDPDIITFGFARRVPSYKRLTLMMRDPDRLKALLLDPERPIQIVIAGKSHPADDGGKALIQQLVQFADAEDVRHRIVFLPDYDISMARMLYPGCDVWMDNPLRPYEACGTSGMKAALNGAANLSIRDGWWDEWYDPSYGWAIPSADTVSDPAVRDDLEASAVYELISSEIVPKFYERDDHGYPARWLRMMRDTVAGLGPKVLASRMVRDYVTELYTPAAAAARSVAAPERARALAQWKGRMRRLWPQVRVEHAMSYNPAGAEAVSPLGDAIRVGTDIHVSALVRLGEVSPDDVLVELVSGRVDGEDQLHETITFPFDPGVDVGDGLRRYLTTVHAGRTGTLGYTVRVVPFHPDLASPAELGLVALPDEPATGAEENVG